MYFSSERFQKVQRRHLLGFVRTVISSFPCRLVAAATAEWKSAVAVVLNVDGQWNSLATSQQGCDERLWGAMPHVYTGPDDGV